MNKDFFISHVLSPKRVLAGDSVEITVKLVLGENFSANKSCIVLDMPANLGYTRPTCNSMEESGYIEVLCSNPDLIYEKRIWNIETGKLAGVDSGKSGMAQRIFLLEFLSGDSVKGDEVLIKWGYTRDGLGVGTKVTSIVPQLEFYNSIHVRYFLDAGRALPDYGRSFISYERPLPNAEIPLKFRILPREAESLRLIRSEKKAFLMVLDRFSNIAESNSLGEYVDCNIEDKNVLKNDYGVFEINNPNVIIKSRELPLLEGPCMTKAFNDMNIYFGDLHTHTVHSIDCIEREKLEATPEQYFEYAKKSSCLDFLAVTDHHEPWNEGRHLLTEEAWSDINKMASKYNTDREFIAFPGFEFRCERGDSTIVLGEDFSYKDIAVPEIKNIKALWEYFKGRNYISIPHFHNPGKLEEGQWYECPYEGVETVLEINSGHGSYERPDVLERRIPLSKKSRPDRYGQYFLENNYRYGFTCNSDGHKGNPGRNGLCAVFARELTREAILEGIRKRHVYGTTNARIKLVFTMNGQLMGSVLPKDSPRDILIHATGERQIKAVDIFRNSELYKRIKPASPGFNFEASIVDPEAANWYVRITQIDNHIAYSSPIWFE